MIRSLQMNLKKPMGARDADLHRQSMTIGMKWSAIAGVAKLVPRLTSAGCLGRAGMLKRALRVQSRETTPQIDQGLPTLIDFNDRKAIKARSVWGDVNFVNPYLLPPVLRERLLLICAIAFPTRWRSAVQVVSLCFSCRKRLNVSSRVVIWNPYSPFHHAVSTQFAVSECYVLAPFYPLVQNCDSFVGLWPIREIYEIHDDSFRELSFERALKSDDFHFSFYLSKLSAAGLDVERALIKFSTFLLNHGFPVRIYLHPSDRSKDSSAALPSELLTVVSRSPSLEGLSSRGICISGISTVGLELHAQGSLQFFFCGAEAPPEFRRWVERSGRELRTELANLATLKRIRDVALAECPELGREVSALCAGVWGSSGP